MDDISVVKVIKPMSSTKMEAEIRKLQEERAAEIDSLAAQIEDIPDEELEESDLPARLKVLQGVNGTQDAEEVMAANTIKIAVRSLSRGEAFQRSDIQREAKRWLADIMGVEEYDQIVIGEVDDHLKQQWMTMYQAADIIPALVPDACDGWDIPEDLEGWAELKDYIYTPALREAWAMNPQYEAIVLSGNR